MDRSKKDEGKSIYRIPPYYYIHVLDQNSNVTKLEVGPQTFIRQDNEKVSMCRVYAIVMVHVCRGLYGNNTPFLLLILSLPLGGCGSEFKLHGCLLKNKSHTVVATNWIL